MELNKYLANLTSLHIPSVCQNVLRILISALLGLGFGLGLEALGFEG